MIRFYIHILLIIVFGSLSVFSYCQNKKEKIIELQQNIIQLNKEKDNLKDEILYLKQSLKIIEEELKKTVSEKELHIQKLEENNKILNELKSNLELKSEFLIQNKFSLEEEINRLVSFNKNLRSRLYENKTIWSGEDSIELYPFEFYTIGIFEGRIDLGMGYPIQFKLTEKNSVDKEIYFDFENIKSRSPKAIEKIDKQGIPFLEYNFIDLSFDNGLIRRLEKGKTYKIIYSYKRDDAIGRVSNFNGCILQGDIIIDIVPFGSKFERQKK